MQGGKIIFKQNTLGSSIVEHNIMQPNISDAFKYKIMQSGTRNIVKLWNFIYHCIRFWRQVKHKVEQLSFFRMTLFCPKKIIKRPSLCDFLLFMLLLNIVDDIIYRISPLHHFFYMSRYFSQYNSTNIRREKLIAG